MLRRTAESAPERADGKAEHSYDAGCGCLTSLGDSSANEKPVSTESQTVTYSVADEPVGSISPGGTASGIIGASGDVDYFSIDLVAGQTYTISLVGSGDTPLVDAYLSLANSGGTIVAFDDDGGAGINSLLTFTATTTGTYQIAAAAYPDSGLTGGYTVDVRQMGSDSVGSTVATAAPVAVNSTTFGFIESNGDVDMYAVTLVAGQYYEFEVAGGADYDTNPNRVPRGELDTRITIYDSAGNVVASNDDISYPDDLSSALAFMAEADGTYYVQIDAYPRQTGGYTLDIDHIDLSSLDPLDTIDWGTQLPSNSVTVYFAPDGETYDGVTSLGWSQYEIDQAMAALQTWAAVTNLTFSITTDSSAATFKLVTTLSNDFLGYFNPPGTANAGVGVFAVNGTGWDTTGGLEQGGYGWITLVHEFGHGLGLAHPHDNGGTSTVMPGVTSPFESYGVFDLNQGVYTTMSYNDGWQLHPAGASSGSVNYGYQGGPGAFDIALVQIKYGASTANTGDNVYVLPTSNAAGTFWDVIWDTAGIDTIQHTGTVSARIDLTAATLDYSPTGAGVISYVEGIFGGFTIAGGVVIENATGGSGADVLIGNQARNILDGGAGDDLLIGGLGADTLDGGTGIDTASYATAASRVVVSLAIAGAQNTGGGGTDTLTRIENLTGSPYGDHLTGNSAANLLVGLAGIDTLQGGGGNDTLDGGDGNDRLYGGSGSDTLLGGAGNDRLDGRAGDDSAAGGTGNDVYYVDALGDSVTENAGEGTDSVRSTVSWTLGDNFENLRLTGTASLTGTGNALANVITGNSGANMLSGLVGNDVLRGGGGADTLDGGAGNDTLRGGTGNDLLDGGAGRDVFYGEGGADTFAFSDGDFAGLTGTTCDSINDFSQLQGDKIGLDEVDANTLVAGDQAFEFIGTAAFSNTAGELRYEIVSGHTFVSGDTNGDGVADFMVRVTGSHALTEGDFVI